MTWLTSMMSKVGLFVIRITEELVSHLMGGIAVLRSAITRSRGSKPRSRNLSDKRVCVTLYLCGRCQRVYTSLSEAHVCEHVGKLDEFGYPLLSMITLEITLPATLSLPTTGEHSSKTLHESLSLESMGQTITITLSGLGERITTKLGSLG